MELINEGYTVRYLLSENRILSFSAGKVNIPVTSVKITSGKKVRIVHRYAFWNLKFEELLRKNNGDWIPVLENFTNDDYSINEWTDRFKTISLY